jgi:diguanylate cyclase (GGDEF)-like protein
MSAFQDAEGGDRLRAQLRRLERSRELIAKAWLVEVLLDTPLAEADRLPMSWATVELPELISDVLRAVAEGSPPRLTRQQLARAAHLAEQPDRAVSPSRLNRELAALQATLLASLRRELLASDPELFGEAAVRLATAFGELSGAAGEALSANVHKGIDPLTGLIDTTQVRSRLEQLVALTKRHGHPFALVLISIEDPGSREADEDGVPAALRIVAGALRRTIRASDEAFRLEGDELGVLAPNQTAEDAERMALRVSRSLSQLDEVDGLPITISAGVVACPEHGDQPELLLRAADTAMWRARATGRPVSVGVLQDL